MDSSVEKVLDVDVCTDKLVLDDSFFDFSNEDLALFERNAQNKMRGVNVMDLGCGLVEVAIPPSIIDDVLTIDESTPPTLVKDILEKTLSETGTAVSNFGSPSDGPTMKLNFEKQSVLSIPKILMKMVITPKVVCLYQISHKTINDIVLNVSNGYDFSKAARTFFEYVTREASGALLEILFNKIKKELIALVTRVATKIIKEKLQIYIGSIAGIYLTNAVTGAIESINVPDTSKFI
jgi:hypothetical protein